MTTDSNGNELHDGDTVQLIKDLKVKGSSLTLKKGEAIKNIRLTDNEEEVDVRIGKLQIGLKTEYLKKRN